MMLHVYPLDREPTDEEIARRYIRFEQVDKYYQVTKILVPKKPDLPLKLK